MKGAGGTGEAIRYTGGIGPSASCNWQFAEYIENSALRIGHTTIYIELSAIRTHALEPWAAALHPRMSVWSAHASMHTHVHTFAHKQDHQRYPQHLFCTEPHDNRATIMPWREREAITILGYLFGCGMSFLRMA